MLLLNLKINLLLACIHYTDFLPFITLGTLDCLQLNFQLGNNIYNYFELRLQTGLFYNYYSTFFYLKLFNILWQLIQHVTHLRLF